MNEYEEVVRTHSDWKIFTLHKKQIIAYKKRGQTVTFNPLLENDNRLFG